MLVHEFFLKGIMLPEGLLLLTILLMVCCDMVFTSFAAHLSITMGLLGLIGAMGVELWSFFYQVPSMMEHVLIFDHFSGFFKVLFMAAGLLQFFSGYFMTEMRPEKINDFHILILSLIVGLMLLVSSCDLIFMCFVLTLVFASSLFLIAFDEKKFFSIESSIKGYICYVIALAALFYASALLFMVSQSFHLYQIQMGSGPFHYILWVGAFFFFIFAFGSIMQVFPLYFLTPDMLQGAPSWVAAFVVFTLRTAGVGVATRILLVVFSQKEKWQTHPLWDWTPMGVILACCSMGFGSLIGFTQSSVKRMIGYILLVQAGFYLMGIVVLDPAGIQALLFNMAVELFSLFGSFYILVRLFKDQKGDAFDDFQGLLQKHPFESISLLAFLLSLTGMPPMPGFIGKFALIGVAISHHKMVLAAIAIGSTLLTTAGIIRLGFRIIQPCHHEVLEDVVQKQPLTLAQKGYLVLIWVPLIWMCFQCEHLLTWSLHAIDFFHTF